MGTTDIVLRSMIFAMIGWIACSYRLSRSNLRPRWRRGLIIPLWFVWMAFGLGGPVYAGTLLPRDALTTAASFTAGMAAYLLLHSVLSSRRSR